MNRFGRLDRGIMNAIDYVGIAKRKRSLNRRDRLDRGIMNVADYAACRQDGRAREPEEAFIEPP